MKLRISKDTKLAYDDEVPPEVMTTLRLLSKKWALPIMYHLYQQHLGFSDLKRAIGKLSSTVLNHASDELQERNLIEKEIISTSPFRAIYTLTALGSDFCQLAEFLGAFGKKYLSIGFPEPK